MRWSAQTLLLAVLLSMLSHALPAVASPPERAVLRDEGGYTYVSHDHIRWTSPDAIVNGLRSTDEQVRLKALLLLGVTDKEAHVAVWGNTSPSTVIGNRVVVADEVKLVYASLGEDATQYAVVSVLLSEVQSTFVGIAAPTDRGGWNRIATSGCWCKYEMLPSEDTLADFISLSPVFEPYTPGNRRHFELVLRASGGGTGIYTKDETHFRVLNGELRRVLSFVSAVRSCTGPSPECKLEARWFYPTAVDGDMGGILIEARGHFVADHVSTAEFSVKGLENRYLRNVRCREYKWSGQEFRYEPFGKARDCAVGDR